MKKNYRRRKLSNSPSILYYGIAVMFALWIMGLSMFMITNSAQKTQETAQNKENTVAKQEKKL